jgi:WD40 repeat protein
MKRFDPRRGLLAKPRPLVSVAILWLMVLGGQASGQVGVDDYTKPILTRNGFSHYAPIKDLAFTPDGKELLSAGLDKVIHVWNLLDPRATRPIRTLRPPIFKGELGQIWTIALSPREESPGQWLLAVAGQSAGSDAGTIVLMRYPGNGPLNAGGTGEILGYLQNPTGEVAGVVGSSGRVSKLAFAPDGRTLVSADVAGNLNVWDVGRAGKPGFGIPDVSNLKPLALNPPRQPLPAIMGMVLVDRQDNDPWIVTGGEDGRILRHELRNSQGARELPYPRLQNERIVCLGGGRNLPWVVAGTSRGRIVKVAIDNSVAPVFLQVDPAQAGWVLAVDASADGGKIAASVRKPLLNTLDPPPIDGCELSFFEATGGATWTRKAIKEAKYPIEAVRFGPNDLAFGGDQDQAVTVLDGPGFDANRPGLKIPGPGSVIWDVGFVNRPDRRVIRAITRRFPRRAITRAST